MVRSRSFLVSVSAVLLALVLAAGAAFAQAYGRDGAQGADAVDFVYVDEAALDAGGRQAVAVALSDAAPRAVSASAAFVRVEDGARFSYDAAACGGAGLLFEFAAHEPGTYALETVEYACADGSVRTIDFSSDAGRPCSFSVGGPEVLGRAASDESVSVYTLSAEGGLESASSFGAAEMPVLSSDAAGESEGFAASLLSRMPSSKQGRIVIALDPGHGGSDPGAVANGLKESELNWKIAQYCKAELEKYAGVEVFMTRGRDETLNSLTERVDRAVAAGARVFVSIHINSASSSAHGAEVWYPNASSWKYEQTHLEGGELARDILDELVALGLTDRGSKIRDWAGSSYENGSTADYYGVIRHARRVGIPAVIVEHAFITNEQDAAMLADDATLEHMGRADARGIAESYGLRTEGSWVSKDGSHRYLIDGEPVTDRWLYTNGSWYRMDARGYALEGWQIVDGSWYYFDPSTGAMYSAAWLEQNGAIYRLSYSGAMNVGWFTADGARYVADGSGALLSGWQCENGTWHYYEPYAATGWRFLGGSWYWFDKLGAMATGFVSVGGDRYYLDASGAMRTGWILDDSGAWHYADASGRNILSGWALIDGAWYWFDDGKARTGWLDLNGTWYHFDRDSCAMDSGWYLIDGLWFYSDESGAMRTGWLYLGETWFWFDSSGVMAIDWRWIDGAWYWFDGSGAMASGVFFDSAGRPWLADQSGRLLDGMPGWRMQGDDWFYLNADGSLQTGWLFAGGAWYYLAHDGVMQTGWIEAGGDRYYLAASGAMATGWVLVDGEPCCFDESGRFVANAIDSLEAVMGAPCASKQVLVDDMARAYERAGATYPASALGRGGAPTLREFCSILYDQAVAEGVRPEVLFCQAMKETGWLRFGGDVKVDQFNFGGLGATGGGVPGERFADVAQGLLAQAQHLKAYGSDAPLNRPCVDGRFSYVKRGTAPYVEWLGIPDNPYGGGWAAADNYGYDLAAMMGECFA
ncbi:N-acetylmuramoyl-L-alanine amidase [Slackia faecicanis]|nr:N-acetylmuramoyl-L-alanine amidase [Slackia faecicanis]